MGVRILYDAENKHACLYCSTTDWAFGPVACGDDAREQLEAFCIWEPDDPRKYSDHELESAWSKFQQFWDQFNKDHRDEILGANYQQLKLWVDVAKKKYGTLQ